MAHTYREVRRTTTREPEAADWIDDDRGLYLIARIVSLTGGIIVSLLALRFILILLGANRENAFASFVYNATHLFVAPFFGLFNDREQIGAVRFEFETLIALAFWAFVTWMIVRLVTIGSRD